MFPSVCCFSVKQTILFRREVLKMCLLSRLNIQFMFLDFFPLLFFQLWYRLVCTTLLKYFLWCFHSAAGSHTIHESDTLHHLFGFNEGLKSDECENIFERADTPLLVLHKPPQTGSCPYCPIEFHHASWILILSYCHWRCFLFFRIFAQTGSFHTCLKVSSLCCHVHH